MTTKVELRERIAELEVAQVRAEAIYEISRGLNTARDEDELLQVLIQPAIKARVTRATLMYIDLDEAGEPEWLEIVATWEREGPPRVRVGSRYYLPEFPFTHLWLASPDEPQLITDVITDEQVDETTRNVVTQAGTRAMAVIPLTQAGGWVGIITFSWDEAHEFSQQETEIYDALIGLATPAAEIRRLLVQKERAVIETLYSISRGLNTARDEDELLQVLVRPAIEAGAILATLQYIDLDEAGEPEWTEIVAVYREGSPVIPVGTRFHIPKFPFAGLWMASPDEPQLIADSTTDERVDEHTRNALIDSGAYATAIVPLTQAGRWVGLLILSWGEAHEFSAQEAEIYRALIGLGSQAVENRRWSGHLEELVEERTWELEKAQVELLRKERLSALGQLTATVAHEIRNPLGTVRTAVFAIGDAIERDELQRVKRARQLAERNIVRCDRIITELLDYTRGQAIQSKPTPIDRWLEVVLDEQTIPEGIVCVRELNTGLEIPIDREYLRRVIVNVVSNAVDALQDEGAAGNQLTVGAHLAGGRLEIRVSDTGPGIPADAQTKIFEPLFSTKRFGVGLGLPIVKNIMAQHGGGIEINSEVGLGATVTLWLPTPDNVGN